MRSLFIVSSFFFVFGSHHVNVRGALAFLRDAGSGSAQASSKAAANSLPHGVSRRPRPRGARSAAGPRYRELSEITSPSAPSRLWWNLSLIHISEPTRQAEISYAVFCL